MNIILIIIIASTVLVSARAFQDRALFHKLLFSSYLIHTKKQYYRFFSHAWVHGDWMHLLVNMYVLFSFGNFLISAFHYYFSVDASLLFCIFYAIALPVSSLFSFRKEKDNPYYNAVGASGGVSAVVFASIFFDPWNMLYFFGVIPIPGFVFGIGYLIYSYRMGQKGTDNIGHDAHFWGAIFGFSFPILMKPETFLIFVDNLFSWPF